MHHDKLEKKTNTMSVIYNCKINWSLLYVRNSTWTLFRNICTTYMYIYTDNLLIIK